ncbi:calcium-translocating P-type ATPase, PMCA-type [Limnoglobus roseus]|uniref:P-type Ca(2+) transporter n=1 Tax=Limnoglobus roseus TaxID=2598579 RepID=A0A5C1AJA0_9BACT|nr:calcium-translocating P-type ATPase, PMCA-type [Limnoglobus roseus]QEL19539.1 calcium-translocating P-type ATPase, PMCA-type [Limnoglobus roseus]
MRTLRAVFELFPNSRDAGLTSGQVGESGRRFGHNRLTPLPRDSVWMKLLAKFDEPIILILLAACLLKLVIDLFEAAIWAGGLGFLATALVFALRLVPRLAAWVPAGLFTLAAGLVALSVGLGHPSYEGLAVMVAVALATGVAFLSEYRSDREFEALNAQKDAIRAKVVRDGGLQLLPLEELVVGDLIALETGDEVPADGRPTVANELLLDQALMTGESEPVEKSACAEAEESDAPGSPVSLYRGTQVVGGVGRMVVTNVGDDTMLGQIARRLSGADPAVSGEADRVQRKLTLSKESTPLQEKLTVLAGLISKIGYLAAVAIFLALFVRGLLAGELRWASPDENLVKVLLADLRVLIGYFVYMVIVIVVAVPEGLPMSVTVSLALAMRKMTRANSLVRQLVACETIGSATVICTDKTGTLTRNRMTVVQVEGDSPVLRRNAAVNSTANLAEKDGKTIVIGNTTEGALLHWLRSQGEVEVEVQRHGVTYLTQSHFSSEKKRMSSVVESEGRVILFVKGAPELILGECDLTPDQRESIQQRLHKAAADGMRTLAFAHREFPAGTTLEGIAGDFTFDGFVGIRDPLRDDVAAAIAECRKAGIDVKMITGDNAETARAVAQDAGLIGPTGGLVLTSDDLAALDDDALKARLPELRVVARAQPLDKYRLVKLLQEQDHVVAMTGDGTNDAPSLRKADVGLAMGITGTEVAKEASKIVLLDDSFSTIVHAVHWGRALYENIQKFIQFQLTINVSALVIAFLGPFLGIKPPFTVLQLLWINVIMDTFAAVALCSELPRRGLMRMPPKRRNESIVTRDMMRTIAITAGFFVAVMVALLLGMQRGGWFAGDGERSAEYADFTTRQVTIFFTVYVLFQVWNQINCRSLSLTTSGLSGLFRNPVFLAIMLITLAVQVAIVTFGGRVFHVEPLAVLDWLAILAATSSVLLFAEVIRRVRGIRRS